MPHRKIIVPTSLNHSMTLSFCSTVLVLCIIFQQLHPHWCYQEIRSYNKRIMRPQAQDTTLSSQTAAKSVAVSKRTLISGNGVGGAVSQPEEIFSGSDQLDSNYDEYPMVVPKRAALLLDRLMVALHHALEKERRTNARLSDFYSKDNGKNSVLSETNGKDGDNIEQQDKDSHYLNMYNDDDPSIMMDYDFKDLNSINRATGETLMAQSFQRRANLGLDLGGDLGMEGVSSLLSSSSSAAHDGSLTSSVNNDKLASGGRANFGANGRMYWRCYFNAVSCF